MLWSVIALMIIVALAIILLPLVRTAKAQTENRRDQNIYIAQEQLEKIKQDKEQGGISEKEYDLARIDLERILHTDLDESSSNAPADSGTSYVMSGILLVLVPISVVALYDTLGSPSLVSLQQATESAKQNQTAKVADIDSMFQGLKKRLDRNPDDVQGWMMMGLSYMYYEQFELALDAYKKADKLLPGDSDIQQALDRALTALSARQKSNASSNVIEKKMLAPNGQTIDVGAMVMRLKAKLEANPDNLQGWMMLGRSYSNLGYHSQAVEAYENALELMPGSAEIIGLLDEARKSAN